MLVFPSFAADVINRRAPVGANPDELADCCHQALLGVTGATHRSNYPQKILISTPIAKQAPFQIAQPPRLAVRVPPPERAPLHLLGENSMASTLILPFSECLHPNSN